jgi:hypothetical protein
MSRKCNLAESREVRLKILPSADSSAVATQPPDGREQIGLPSCRLGHRCPRGGPNGAQTGACLAAGQTQQRVASGAGVAQRAARGGGVAAAPATPASRVSCAAVLATTREVGAVQLQETMPREQTHLTAGSVAGDKARRNSRKWQELYCRRTLSGTTV